METSKVSNEAICYTPTLALSEGCTRSDTFSMYIVICDIVNLPMKRGRSILFNLCR